MFSDFHSITTRNYRKCLKFSWQTLYTLQDLPYITNLAKDVSSKCDL